MAEDLHQLFAEYVQQLQDQLVDVDQKHPDTDEECRKYVEKLGIYKNFTDGLINNGFQYLDVIKHLKDELAQTNFDVASITSTGTLNDEKIHSDLEFLKNCLHDRRGKEEKALNSLVELEAMVNVLLRENVRLTDENRALHALLEQRDAPESESASNAKKVITSLNHENEDLKKTIRELRQASEQPTARRTSMTAERQCDCELEQLSRQLADKDTIIKQLSAQVRDLVRRPSMARASESMDSSCSETSVGGSKLARSRSDETRPSGGADSGSLTDGEKRDHFTLEKGYKELLALLKEKYDQLRKQRAKIDELTKKLTECLENEDELVRLKDECTKLEEERDQLKEDLKEMNACEDIKKQATELSLEMEHYREREQILARKLTLQAENISALMAERQHLLKLNNEMLNSISTCKSELGKYKNLD